MTLNLTSLESRTIRFRFVEERDAAFILTLRLDERYNQHLSKVEADVNKQRAWINEYKKDEEQGVQYYFIIERLDGTPCGTVRVYDLKPDSFCWGSWILNEDKTRYAAIETALLIYRFGFEILKFEKSHFEVDKRNTHVVSFHEKFGAQKIAEDEVNHYFEFYKTTYHDQCQKLSKYLSN